MERITGVGGIFFRSPEPERLRAWYAEHLGLVLEEWGGAVLRSTGGETLVWAIFDGDTTYFPRESMVNYRVSDLDAMLAQLRDAGAEVDEHVEESDSGRFGWGVDCDGNRFELWQPPAGM